MSAPSGSDASGGSAGISLLLPAALADAAGGQRVLSLPVEEPAAGTPATGGPGPAGAGTTVAGVLAVLRDRQPGVYSRICDETGSIRRYVNIYLDGEDIRELAGRATVLAPGAELLVLQSIAGG